MVQFKEKNQPPTPKLTELEPAQEKPRWDPAQSDIPPSKPQWARKAQESWRQVQQTHQVTKQQQDNNTWYWYDARNAHHAKLSWTACTHEYCPAHYSEKQYSGWNPKAIKGYPKCKHYWFECVDDTCPKHLWDKREKTYFPGHDDPQEVIQMQMVYRVECAEDYAYECRRPNWHTCLKNECDLHQEEKNYHGFAKSFLG